MLWLRLFTIAIFYAAYSESLGLNSDDGVIDTIKAASGSLPVQIFQDFDPSDVTKLVQAKERAQRHITENNVIARFAEEVENPHHFRVAEVHNQEFIDNATAFVKHLQYRPPNCGRPFDVFKLLEVVQDARRAEEQRILKEHTSGPDCTMRCCTPGGPPSYPNPTTRPTKCTSKAKAQPVVTPAPSQNKLWNPNSHAQKVKQSLKEVVSGDKEHPVNLPAPAAVWPDESGSSEVRTKTGQFTGKQQLSNELTRPKLKYQKAVGDQPIWQRPFQQRQSAGRDSKFRVEEKHKRQSAQLIDNGVGRYYSQPGQKRKFTGSLHDRVV